jgi:hypothetical protein
MRCKLLTGSLFAAFFAALASTAVAGTTWYVNGVSGSDGNTCLSSTAPCKTIGHAHFLASSGDSIKVAAATYKENLTITINLGILGSGASTTIIDGGANGRVLTISNGLHVTLSKLTIRNGKASSGGGISNSGTLTLTNSTVSGNLAPIPCIFLGLFCNLITRAGLGGGIYNSGALIISNSVISGNHAGSYCNTNTCSAFGGGIYNRGTLTIQKSTLSGNSASTACSTSLSCKVGSGGALYSIGSAVMLNNSTVTGSTAYRCSGTCTGTGGAIVNGSGKLVMSNSTISGNSAGGIVNRGTAILQNSIMANNVGKNCGGAITSHGFNLSSDGSCAFSNTGDRDNTNPVLGTLGYYGGPTPTIPLLTGSPAIDAGNPSGCTDGLGHLLKTDQRGFPRPDTEDISGCDMGAFERQSD